MQTEVQMRAEAREYLPLLPNRPEMESVSEAKAHRFPATLALRTAHTRELSGSLCQCPSAKLQAYTAMPGFVDAGVLNSCPQVSRAFCATH